MPIATCIIYKYIYIYTYTYTCVLCMGIGNWLIDFLFQQTLSSKRRRFGVLTLLTAGALMYSAFARSPGSRAVPREPREPRGPGFVAVPCVPCAEVGGSPLTGLWVAWTWDILGYLGMSGEKVGSHRRRSIDFHVVTEGHSIVKWNSNFIWLHFVDLNWI